MDILGDFPGLPGLFVAGVFSAALRYFDYCELQAQNNLALIDSSLSTGLNSMSAVMLEDFFKTFSKVPLTDKQTGYIMRGVVAIFGAICVCLVLVVEKLGSVLQLSMSLGAVTNGPLLGIFTMGVMFPWVHGHGALIGGSTGLGVMAWICAKAQAAIASGELRFDTKPVNTLGCSYTFIASEPMNMLAINTTETIIPEIIEEPQFAIYHLSYLWYTLLGAVITIIVSMIASFAIGANDPRKIHPTLLAPFVRTILWPNRKNFKRDDPIGNENDAPFTSCVDLKNYDITEKKINI